MPTPPTADNSASSKLPFVAGTSTSPSAPARGSSQVAAGGHARQTPVVAAASAAMIVGSRNVM